MPTFGASFRAVRERSGLDIVFGGLARPRAESFAITRTSGGCTDLLDGLVIRTGQGLGGQVLASARPAVVHDYLRDERITHAYDAAVAGERMRTVSAFPVVVRGTTRGVLYGASRDAAPLSSHAASAMQQASDAIGFDLAVEEAVDDRVGAAETAEVLRAAQQTAPDREWEHVRAAFAELRKLAQEVSDAGIRSRLDSILDRMTSPEVASGPQLSSREIDVLALVALGCANSEIGVRLNIGAETVKSYLRTASRKLGAANRVEAVRLARACGQLP